MVCIGYDYSDYMDLNVQERPLNLITHSLCDIDDAEQDHGDSSVLAMELPQSRAN